MQMPKLPADTGAKIMHRIDALAAISESDSGLTRRFATPEHRRANDLMAQWMRAAGMQVHEDAIGNIVGRYEAATDAAPAIVLGSHLDTVVMAGKYDGMLGVLTGLACVELLEATNTRLPCAVEVIGFADEEGVRYHGSIKTASACAMPLRRLARILPAWRLRFGDRTNCLPTLKCTLNKARNWKMQISPLVLLPQSLWRLAWWQRSTAKPVTLALYP